MQEDFEQLANDLQQSYNDRAKLVFSFDEPLSHMIYAGCDLILVPSMFEPCGLTQMIGMRYGTVAVVRKTGGLADTVFDVDDDEDRAEAYGMEVRSLELHFRSICLRFGDVLKLACWSSPERLENELACRSTASTSRERTTAG